MPNVSVVFVSTPHVCPSAWSRSHSTFSICTPYSPRLGRRTISLRRDGSYNTGHMAETSDPAKPATSSEAGAVSSTQTTACGEPPRTPCRQTQSPPRWFGMESQQLLTQRQILQHEVLAGSKCADKPADEAPKQRNAE